MKVASDVSDIITLKPDPGLVNSLGSHHTIQTALADLIDNCIDAEASRVAVRLLTRRDKLVQVEVFDNGKGMNEAIADKAMTLGHQRDYLDGDLGHFGVGLKAASFGQCDILTIWSSAAGCPPVGRRIRKADFSKRFACERLKVSAATAAQGRRNRAIGSRTGTTVVWTSLHSTYQGNSEPDAQKWMAETERSLRSHLGLTFHRWIQSNRVTIEILVADVNATSQAIAIPVDPVDPFGYLASGYPGYPKTLIAKAGPHTLPLQCHIWPARTDIPGFRLNGRSGEKFQGLFVYRNDRLLNAGGWLGTASSSRQRQLARVVIDDASAFPTFFRMNPEKNEVQPEEPFRSALARAKAADGTTFDGLLAEAERMYRDTRQAGRRRSVISPGRGFAPELRKHIRTEVPFIKSESLDIRWRNLRRGQFMSVNHSQQTLWINQKYRHLIAPNGSLNDAPLVKALLFLLTHELFEGERLGPKHKDDLALWQSILGAAAELEAVMRDE